MLKKRLITPGPTQVPEEALLEMAKQVTHHRTSEFKKTFEKVLAGLKVVFQTSGDVIVLTSSGSGAMEAAMVTTVPRGGKAIVLDAGRFAKPCQPPMLRRSWPSIPTPWPFSAR